MAIEKNMAALLREDAKTIRVTFYMANHLKDGQWNPATDGFLQDAGAYEDGQRMYTYVTHYSDLIVGDLVLVEAAGNLKCAKVREIDDTVKVDPQATFELRWVIMKVDLEAHNTNMQRNKEIEELVAQAYQKNLRRSFAQQIMAGVDDDSRNNLQKLLGAS